MVHPLRLLGPLLLAVACTGAPPADPGLSLDQLTRLVRKDAVDRAGWAADVRVALQAAERPVDAEHACQVFATIEQESGYEADPEVPGLAGIVAQGLEEEVNDKLGFLGPTALELILDVAPEGESRTFREQLDAVRTEQELDRTFRSLVAHHGQRAPAIARGLQLVFPRLLERLNPISTAGSMQVNVGYAQDHRRSNGLSREQVRDLLYTRAGGVLYGTLRLFDHDAPYEDPIYRFADYNAGQYASRNAAFQDVLTVLTGTALTPDGDLLIWNKRGKASGEVGETLQAVLDWRTAHAPELSDGALRRQLKKEKTAALEDTEVWTRVRAQYQAEQGKEPPYARVPDVALDSPKLKGTWTTRTFAERVKRRYRDCLRRGR